MDTTINVLEVEQKQTKAGASYWSIGTDQGKMACFDEVISKALQANLGKFMSVEVQEVKGYKNIKKLLSPFPVEKPAGYAVPIPASDKFAEARKDKNTAMYVSYVKDLVVAGMKPEEAIEVIKKSVDVFS